jgi:hypothetical protein
MMICIGVLVGDTATLSSSGAALGFQVLDKQGGQISSIGAMAFDTSSNAMPLLSLEHESILVCLPE